MKTMMKTTIAATLAVLLLWTTGCQQTSQVSTREPAYTAPVVQQPAPQPAPQATATRQNCAEPTAGLVRLAKQMPKEAILGQTFEYQLEVTANDCIGNVVVTDQVPAGASYVKSQPAAEVEGNHLVWNFNQMDPGQKETIRVTLKADKEGTLASCATVAANPRVCASTIVGKPALTIDKSGPEQVVLNATFNDTIVVGNNGSAVAKNVVLTDNVPNGLESTDGRKTLTWELGDLAPKQSKSVTVPLKAVQRGRFVNPAVAKSSNAGEVSDDTPHVVLQPGLKIVKSGTKEQWLGRRADHKIVVTNTGDTTLTDLVITDTAPAPTSIVAAPGATVTGNTAVWRVASLAPGKDVSFDLVLTSQTRGTHNNTVGVVSGPLKDNAEAATLWKGVGALLLQKADDPDPIQVGETTTYMVRVTNQGTADDTNIKMVVEFPEEVTPVSADNNGTVRGNTVTFPAYPRLAPKAAFEYHITAKGAKAGDARVKFIRTSDDIPAPTTAEESTRVY